MSEIELKLTVDEINLVLEACGNMPYIRIANVINKMSATAKAQVEKGKAD
jgi:hypothetical protein